MKLFLGLAISLIATSCATMGPITATGNPVGSVKGEACAANILGIIPLSTDASIYKAAKQGGVKNIATVDREIFLSGFYNSACTIVRGTK